jgi:hypothetical protein
MFLFPAVPAPLAIEHFWFGATNWTLNVLPLASAVGKVKGPGPAIRMSLPPLSLSVTGAVMRVIFPPTVGVVVSPEVSGAAPPPQETTIPARTDAISTLRTFRTFTMSPSFGAKVFPPCDGSGEVRDS